MSKAGAFAPPPWPPKGRAGCLAPTAGLHSPPPRVQAERSLPGADRPARRALLKPKRSRVNAAMPFGLLHLVKKAGGGRPSGHGGPVQHGKASAPAVVVRLVPEQSVGITRKPIMIGGRHGGSSRAATRSRWPSARPGTRRWRSFGKAVIVSSVRRPRLPPSAPRGILSKQPGIFSSGKAGLTARRSIGRTRPERPGGSRVSIMRPPRPSCAQLLRARTAC